MLAVPILKVQIKGVLCFVFVFVLAHGPCFRKFHPFYRSLEPVKLPALLWESNGISQDEE